MLKVQATHDLLIYCQLLFDKIMLEQIHCIKMNREILVSHDEKYTTF